jgi:L-2-hydroxyglutarate oxidase LhgO
MSESPDRVDCVVIGAGVVGLAIARSLALSGREVIVLDACSAIGTQTSARNSEVIHAGIYYATGSLKASLCVQGKSLLYAYCQERHVPHRRCGKLIVATQEQQVRQLHDIRAKAEANGVADLALLSQAQVKALEPALQCVAALHSPSTGIVDSHALMLALLGDLENLGGVLALNSAVDHVRIAQSAIELIATDGTRLMANTVVNAAGHGATKLAAKMQGLPGKCIPRSYYAKGSYFSLAGRNPFSHLIYPVPEVAGLGVHLTLDMAGQARFGPDVQWVERPDDLEVDAARGDVFYAEVRKYWPQLADAALIPAYAGIRPKISGPDAAASDFCIQGPEQHGVPGLVNLFGIESPGLTSAIAIGQYVTAMCEWG